MYDIYYIKRNSFARYVIAKKLFGKILYIDTNPNDVHNFISLRKFTVISENCKFHKFRLCFKLLIVQYFQHKYII